MARTTRAPVIAVMGHIDHGKSSLLDYVRKSNVVAGEAGGITQHVAAYVAKHGDRSITFLDTPGHEAFKALRARGAQAADIAILVVAADEGVMPQTLDALSSIREAKIPFVVAITKIDKNNADIERAKTSLLEHEVFLEGLGGDVPYAPISSKTGAGVPELLDLVLLAADMIGLSADSDAPAEGFVLESGLDPKRGAGATLIVKDGTLSLGGFIVAGDAFAPVRFIENFLGTRVETAGPSEPAVVSGFSKLPPAGTPFAVFEKKKDAEAAVKKSASEETLVSVSQNNEGRAELPLVIKADVAGSVDAILHELEKITHERAMIRILSSGVGSVSENDIKQAGAGGGVVIAFNVGTDAQARELGERDHVPIETFSIIYELSAKVKELLAARAPHVSVEQEQGRATVLKTFSSETKKQVLGLRYVSGALTLGNQIKIMRRDIEIARGKIGNLQQARVNVKEIKTEGDFGAEIEAREDALYGDILVAFTVAES
ncbi:MAG: translation initiation factor IF-2 [bacterium]|nr:translation initiation factor IF-2 [bacterium]